MRRTNQREKKNSTHHSRIANKFDARRSISALEERLSRLELLFQVSNGLAEYRDEIPSTVPKRPGPKPIHVPSLRIGRDNLVQMLEDYWPEIEAFCIPRVNA
jgi:hypothetical protein